MYSSLFIVCVCVCVYFDIHSGPKSIYPTKVRTSCESEDSAHHILKGLLEGYNLILRMVLESVARGFSGVGDG